MIKALVVDGEQIARQELRYLLNAHPDVAVVAEAADVVEARHVFRAYAPSLVLIDVEMPGDFWLQFAREIEDQTDIVFCTARDVFTAKAFAVSAIGYLFKPVESERLARVLSRLRRHDSGAGYLAYNYGIMLRFGESSRVVRLREVDVFESIGNYVAVHCRQGMSMLLGTLSRIEKRLDPQYFIRANRSEIIRIDAIRSIDADVGHGMIATLHGGKEIEISRRQAQAMRARMAVF